MGDEKTEELEEFFSVASYPTLAIVNAKTGEIVSADAKEKLLADPDGVGFPWPDKTIESESDVKGSGGSGAEAPPALITEHIVVRKAVLRCNDGLSGQFSMEES